MWSSTRSTRSTATRSACWRGAGSRIRQQRHGGHRDRPRRAVERERHGQRSAAAGCSLAAGRRWWHPQVRRRCRMINRTTLKRWLIRRAIALSILLGVYLVLMFPLGCGPVLAEQVVAASIDLSAGGVRGDGAVRRHARRSRADLAASVYDQRDRQAARAVRPSHERQRRPGRVGSDTDGRPLGKRADRSLVH